MRRLIFALTLGVATLAAAGTAMAGVVSQYTQYSPYYGDEVVVYQAPAPPPPPVVIYQQQAPPPPPQPVMANPLVPALMLGLGVAAVAAIAAHNRPRHVHHYNWRPPARPYRPYGYYGYRPPRYGHHWR